jgi:hypothetical protein
MAKVIGIRKKQKESRIFAFNNRYVFLENSTAQ